MEPITSLKKDDNGVTVFDTNLLKLLGSKPLPNEFVWPSSDLVSATSELNEPLVDLSVVERNDDAAIAEAAGLVRMACLQHGFFQVTNHGVDPLLIRAAYDEIDSIFGLPLETKLSARRKRGEVSGYSGAHADRYNSKLPWKETFSFEYKNGGSETQIVEHFNSLFGDELEHTGRVYQRFCEAMKEVGEMIMELLAISLGVDRGYFKEYFKDGGGIMRCNHYPSCNSSTLTMGTGPHSDPTSLTILHQDQVGGLQVLIDDKWLAVRPNPDAFVINLGDTFQALTNGRYKSCLHRAVVDTERERRSLVFFVCPRKDKIVKPPETLFGSKLEEREYPDFTWLDLFNFVQLQYRPDLSTLSSFVHSLRNP